MDPTQTLTLEPYSVAAEAAPARTPVIPASQTSRRSGTYQVASITFLSMAALDAFEPTILVTGAWWLVLLFVWLMP